MTDQLSLVPGTLDVLVLKAVSWGPIHGYGVSRLIDDRSAGALQVDELPEPRTGEHAPAIPRQ